MSVPSADSGAKRSSSSRTAGAESVQTLIIRREETSPGETLHRARWVVADSDTVFPDGYVVESGGVIREVGTGRPPAADRNVDRGDVALLPGLINAHVHLELTALADQVPAEGGFEAWVRSLLAAREAAGEAALRAGAEDGAAALRDSGCAAVGEVTTLGISWEATAGAGLAGVWFREFLGGEIPPAEALSDQTAGDLSASVAGHAPHTAAPELLQALRKFARERWRPFSLHLAESEAEVEFLATGRGDWADFLAERGIDVSGWGLPARSPLDHADRLGLLGPGTLLVHLLRADAADFRRVQERGAAVCVCPRSNQRLHGRLPDLDAMFRAGLRPALGTDGRASVGSLNLFDKMAFAAERFPGIPPGLIFDMATRNGADALGIGNRYGTLAPGRRAVFSISPVSATTSTLLLERIVHDTAAAG
ncbi:MAG: amidohydrolase family protein [Thermodesulfobacteriota bacterium]